MRSSFGSLGFAAYAAAAAIFACCTGAALAQDAPPEAKLRAAEHLLSVQGADAFSPKASDALVELILADFRRRQPDLAQACWDAMKGPLSAVMRPVIDGIRDKAIHAYAVHLEEDDLNAMNNFFGSELGKRYLTAAQSAIAGNITQQGIIQGTADTRQEARGDLRAGERLAIMLGRVRNRMTEDDIIAITNFFSLGAGKRFLEQAAVITRDVSPDPNAMREAGQRVGAELRQNGACT